MFAIKSKNINSVKCTSRHTTICDTAWPKNPHLLFLRWACQLWVDSIGNMAEQVKSRRQREDWKTGGRVKEKQQVGDRGEGEGDSMHPVLRISTQLVFRLWPHGLKSLSFGRIQLAHSWIMNIWLCLFTWHNQVIDFGLLIGFGLLLQPAFDTWAASEIV